MAAYVTHNHIPEGGKGRRINRNVKVTFSPEAIDAARELDGRLIGLIVANKDGDRMFTFAGPATKRFAARVYALHLAWHTHGKLDHRKPKPVAKRFAYTESEQGHELLILEDGMYVYQINKHRRLIEARMSWKWRVTKSGYPRWQNMSGMPKWLRKDLERFAKGRR